MIFNKISLALLVIYLLIRILLINAYYSDLKSDGILQRIYTAIAPVSFKLSEKKDLPTEERIIGSSDSYKHVAVAKNFVNHGLPFLYLDDLGYFIIQPGYSFFIALFFAVGLGIKSILYAQIIISLLTSVIIYYLVHKVTHSYFTGNIALIILTFHPSLLWTETNLWAESLYTFFVTCFIAFYFNYYNNFIDKKTKYLNLFLLLMSVSISIACFIRPVSTLFPLFIVVLLYILNKYQKNKINKDLLFKPLIYSYLFIILLMLPWSIYVYSKTNIIVWGSGGRESGKLTNIFTNENYELKHLGKAVNGEIKKEPLYKHVLSYIKNIPLRFARLWFGLNYDQPISQKNKILLTISSILWIFSIIGLIAMIKKKNLMEFIFLFGFVIYITFIHQIVGQRLRYSFPGIPFLIALASIGFVSQINYIKTFLKKKKYISHD